MKTTVPFSGFYNSLHDDALSTELDEHLFLDSDTGMQVHEGLLAHAQDVVDWPHAFEQYARHYTEALSDALEIKFVFESIYHPREYNFTTDVIFATIKLTEVRKLRKKTDEKPFRDLARERFTSRSGFHSFYDPDVDTWGPVKTWDHHQVGCLLEACAIVELGRDGEFAGEHQMDLMETAQGNGYYDQWLTENNPEMSRLLKIRDYLEKRSKR